MTKWTGFATGAGMLLTMVAAGCAQKTNRVAMLEDANRNLTQQLNQGQVDLGSANSERNDLRERLIAAESEAANLRSQLADRDARVPIAPGWQKVPGGAMIAIEGHVLFAPGRNVIRKEAQRTLDAVVSAIEGDYADKDVLVFGHTDNQPIKKSGWNDNWQLSSERALAVVRYLKEHGVSGKRLIASGCGAHRPRTDNTTEANRAANRRVEIFAINPTMLASE